jgi:hypothetical protein
MGKLGKTVAFCAAALLLFSGMFMVEPSSAQSKPQTPQFTLSVLDNAVVLTIENQPFDVHNSNNYTFYYAVKILTAGYYWPISRDTTSGIQANQTPPTQPSPIQLAKAASFPH